MKRLTYSKSTLFVAALTLSAGVGCQKPSPELQAPYTAQVLKFSALSKDQSPSDPISYIVGPGTFKYLRDLNEMKGDYFQMVQGGILHPRTKEPFGGETPKLHYEVKDGVIIPKDDNTLAMLSSMYHFDTIAHHLKTMTGIEINSMKQKHGVYKVFFEPAIKLETDSLSIYSAFKLNAAYVPGRSKFILFHKSSVEKLPISENLNVISHEFGHAVWDYLTSVQNVDAFGDFMNEYAVSGLNEGWADWISYTLTGSTNIIYNSIAIRNVDRQRNFSTVSFHFDHLDAKHQSNRNRNANESCGPGFYCIGTLFAKSLFNAQETLKVDQARFDKRGEFTAEVVQALSHTRAALESSKIPPPLRNRSTYDQTVREYDGKILGNFFNAFLSKVSDADTKSAICVELISNFRETGFPKEFRTECNN